MIKLLRLSLFLLICIFSIEQSYAQFPYIESFRRTASPGIVFGGAPSAFLTAAGSAFDPATQTHSGTPIDPDGQGYLRLTNNSRNQKGYIYSSADFPSSNGLTVDLEYYTYGGNGADGITFFLFDATASPFVIGGFGGSLGYAQITTTTPISPGVSKGYLAVGLDEYGNFSNNTEGRQGGFAGRRPGSVTLRGKGDGAGLNPDNYKFLTNVVTSTLPGGTGFSLVGNTTARTPDPTNSGYRRVFIDMAPNPLGGYNITVKITIGGPTMVTRTVIDNYYYPEAAPALLRYGLASSTGTQTNFHEIRNVAIDVFDSANLINPVATNDNIVSCDVNSAILDVTLNDKTDNPAGVLNKSSIDLNPTIAGLQSSFIVAGRGTFSLTSTGLVQFIPDNPFVGNVTCSYTVKDNYGRTSNPADITVQYVPTPTAPNAGPDAIIPITTATASYVLSGNAAISGTGTWTQVSGPSIATFANPAANNTSVGNLVGGTYVFRWSITSGTGCNLHDDVQLIVNHAPTAVNDSYRTNLNTAVILNILDNDTDLDGNATLNKGSISIKSVPSHGTYTINNVTGTVTYTPALDYSGDDFFTYTVKDAQGTESNIATVVISINVKPVGSPDVATTSSGSPINIPVNDNDLDKVGITVLKETDPTHGTIIVNANGTIQYTPTTGYSGKDSFTYRLRNPTGLLSDPILVSIDVNPIGSTDNISTKSNVPVVIPVKNNDLNSAGTTILLNSNPAYGSVILDANGTPFYTPSSGFTGTDNFTYRLRTLDGLQSDPILVNIVVRPTGTDDVTTTVQNYPVTIPVKDNDLNKTGTTVVLNSNPANGTVSVDGSNNVIYTPATGFLGTNTFTYILRTSPTIESDPITVTVTIKPSIPAPDITTTATTGSPKIIDVPVPPSGTVFISVPPKHGTITIDPLTAKPIYTPNPGYSGPDDFTYIIRDANGYESVPGKVTLDVKKAAKIGVAKALLSNVINSDGSFRLTYLLTLVNYGDVAIDRVSLTDNLAATFPARSIVINRINGSGTLRTNAAYNGTTVTDLLLPTSTLSANFKEQVELEVTVGGNQLGGTFNNSATGLGYSTADGILTTDISTTGLTPDPTVPGDVTPATPTQFVLLFAPNVTIPATSGEPTIVNVGVPTGGTVVITNPPANGTITFDPTTGNPIYTPNPGYSGPDNFTYIIRDANGNESQPGTITINVTVPARIGLAKALVSNVKNPDGTYNLRYTFTLVNYGDFAINQVSLTENLSIAFAGVKYEIVRASNTSGNLRINPNFNGTSNTNMLLSTSTLAAKSKDQVDLELKITLGAESGRFTNFATVEGVSANNGAGTTDQSTNGFNPDPDTPGDVTPAEPTVATLTKENLKIPAGFSPNNDGINDFFVIENAEGKTIALEVFNRWGNRIYRSKNYQNDWAGRSTEGISVGNDVPVGTYYYIVTLDGKDKRVGYITINR